MPTLPPTHPTGNSADVVWCGGPCACRRPVPQARLAGRVLAFFDVHITGSCCPCCGLVIVVRASSSCFSLNTTSLDYSIHHPALVPSIIQLSLPSPSLAGLFTNSEPAIPISRRKYHPLSSLCPRRSSQLPYPSIPWSLPLTPSRALRSSPKLQQSTDAGSRLTRLARPIHLLSGHTGGRNRSRAQEIQEPSSGANPAVAGPKPPQDQNRRRMQTTGRIAHGDPLPTSDQFDQETCYQSLL
ncbi:hypothetical protein VDGL01_00236 [Verticillium dahliae]